MFYSLSLLVLTILLLNSSPAYATRYSGGEINLYVSEQQRIDLSEMLAEAMNKYGAGYPYSWKSSNSAVFRTSMPSRTHCNVYACGAGTAELTYHGEYYRDAAIHDIDCTWTVNVIIKDNGGDDPSEGGDGESEPIGETWIDIGNYDYSWYSEGVKSFSLSTPEQLAGLSYLVNNGTDFENKTISLANDISLEGKRWIGIGSVSDMSFKGVFDGKKHTISGLNIAIREDDGSAGFFGYIDHAKIQNINIEGVMDANNACGYIGGLAGCSTYSEISNITCNIPIYINNNLKKYGNNFELSIKIGGLIGHVADGSISYTKYNGEIILKQYPKAAWYSGITLNIGGLLGYCGNNKKLSFSESKCSEISVEIPTWEKYEYYANAPTAPEIRVGGLIGWGSIYNLVKCCKSQCDLINVISHGFPFASSPRVFIGTLIAFTNYGNSTNHLTNCLGILKSVKTKENKIDLFFFANNCSWGSYSFCNSDVSISQEIGQKWTHYENATFYKLEEMKTDAFLDKLNDYSEAELYGSIWEKSDDGYPQLKQNAGIDENDPVEIYDETWQDEGNYDTSWFNYRDNVFTINTPQELAGIAHVSLPFYITIKLGSDIDMSGKMWVGDYLAGITFDGQNHKITGLNILADEDNTNVGFFYQLRECEIKNVTLEGMINGDLSSDGSAIVGGLVGSVYSSTIKNVNCNIDINIDNDVDKYDNGFGLGIDIGGICGFVSESSLSHIRYSGKIIINQHPSVISYKSLSASIGGIVGYNHSTNIEYAEARCPKIKCFIPENKGSGDYTRIYSGVICGQVSEGSFNYCSGICNKMFVDNKGYVDYVDGAIGNIVGYRFMGSNITKNCYGIINQFRIALTDKFKYYANNATYATDCFSNSDVEFKNSCFFQKIWDNVKTYTTEEMKTESFLEQLNKYSIKNLGSPVWEFGDDGFPQLIDLHNTSGISPIVYDTEATNKGVFSLYGTKLATPKRGINIINGNKVVVK